MLSPIGLSNRKPPLLSVSKKWWEYVTAVERYQLYFAAGATLNGTMEWFRNDCRESLDEFYRVMLDFLGSNISE